jgi:malate-CoA ligase subunit beta
MNIKKKKILSDFGVKIPTGGIVYSPENAENKAREIGGSKWVVKAQVHSGDRRYKQKKIQ